MDYLIYNLADSYLSEHADTSLLSEAERATAATRGERYILTRCLLRRELARRLGCTPQELRFRVGEHGKPECEGCPIHFNISHSGDCFAMAFDAAPVGIDVECIRPHARMKALAARIMCPEQLSAFHERGCPAEEFHACWCTAEALVKQSGSTIWRAKDTAFVFEHDRIRLPAASGLSVRLFTPLPGYAGAVVFREQPQPAPPHDGRA